MSEEFTPSVSEEVSSGPTLEEQAVEMGIEVGGQEAPATQFQREEPQPTQADVNDLIAGKFQSQEELIQAYQGLEQRMGQQGTDLSQPLTQAGEYFAEHGVLSDDHYAQLEGMGLPRTYVDSYIDGMQATQQNTTHNYYQQVGGQENYQQMSNWMTQYLPDTEIDAYNKVMQDGTDAEVSILMSGMYSRYSSAMNVSYEQLQGQSVSDTPLGFQSRGQVMEALNDPRYDTDSQYRHEFEGKLAMTPEDIF